MRCSRSCRVRMRRVRREGRGEGQESVVSDGGLVGTRWWLSHPCIAIIVTANKKGNGGFHGFIIGNIRRSSKKELHDSSRHFLSFSFPIFPKHLAITSESSRVLHRVLIVFFSFDVGSYHSFAPTSHGPFGQSPNHPIPLPRRPQQSNRSMSVELAFHG